MFNMFNMYERPAGLVIGLLVISIWVLIWKGLGLWYSGKNQQKWWFIAMLIFNTMGLLPIVYLIWFKPKENKLEKVLTPKKSVTKKAAKRKKK